MVVSLSMGSYDYFNYPHGISIFVYLLSFDLNK